MRIRRLLVWTVAIASVSLAAATEPDGHLALRPEWVSRHEAAGHPLRAGERLLRLGLRTFGPLRESRLRFDPPAGVRLRVLSGPADALPLDGPGREPPAWRLRDLGPGESRELWLAVEIEDGSNGILALTVEGQRGDGRPFREAVGLPVGQASSAGRHRAGALEFPARVLAPDDDR